MSPDHRRALTTRRALAGFAATAAATLTFTTSALAAPLPVAPTGFTANSFAPGTSVTFTADCNRDGVSTITYDATGIATGTYTGTFEEHGVITIGPMTDPVDPAIGGSGLATGAVLDVAIDFSIESVAGTVTGEKRLSTNGGDLGRCYDLDHEPAFGSQDVVGQFLEAIAPLEYEATIVDQTGTYSDSGTAAVSLSKTELLIQSDGGGSTSTSGEFFTERFLTSTGVVRADSDGDGVLDGDDNCPSTPNANPRDTDGDGIGDDCDPFPGSTAGCKVTGGGHLITAAGSTATFGMVAQAKTATQVRGQQTYVDHSTLHPVRFKSITTLSAICAGNAVTIRGTGEANSQPVEYRIDAVDNGEDGSFDTFRIRLSNGYDSGMRPLEGGNLQVNA